MPKFQNMEAWQQAETLMQPAFIRLVANISKQLDESSWSGRYEDVPVWAEGITEETKARVLLLRRQLDESTGDDRAAIESALAQLPAPHPGYLLCLTRGDRHVTIDVWDLCYQTCFYQYDSLSGTSHPSDQSSSDGVEVDVTLFDDTGDVDWHRLDDKAHQVVEQIFVNLPD